MYDQAETLRRMMQSRQPAEKQPPSFERRCTSYGSSPGVPVLTVASGKGGVGKTCLTAHLGTLLARAGLRVMLVDGDFGLANLDIVLGVQAGATLEEVLSGRASLQDAVVGVEPNLWLVPSASGLLEMKQSPQPTREKLLSLFEDCPWEMDLILVDVGAGIQPNVLSLHNPAFRSMIVVTPEPTALMDAYGLIKLLNRHTAVSEFHIIVNQVTGEREGRAVFQKLKDVADRFIDVRMEYLGSCANDEKIKQAVMNRKILVDWEVGGESLSSVALLAMNLQSKFVEKRADFSEVHELQDTMSSESGNTGRFWKTLFESASAQSGAVAGTMAGVVA